MKNLIFPGRLECTLPWAWLLVQVPPEPVTFPRRSLELNFAVLLMRSGYEAVDDLDFIPMVSRAGNKSGGLSTCVRRLSSHLPSVSKLLSVVELLSALAASQGLGIGAPVYWAASRGAVRLCG